MTRRSALAEKEVAGADGPMGPDHTDYQTRPKDGFKEDKTK